MDNYLLNFGKTSEDNTWNRYKKIIPDIEKNSNFIKIRYNDLSCVISRFEESILIIIAQFNFCPIWLVEQWLKNSYINFELTSEEIIMSWINLGIVWIEPSVTGEYLRPTYFLFNLFNIQDKKYVDIPFNKLTHTICEEQIMFSIMTGQKNDPLNNCDLSKLFIDKFSPLGLQKNEFDTGTNIIREDEFRSLNIYTEKFIPDLEQNEYNIKEEIKNHQIITSELRDFKNFVIVKKINNTGTIKKDYMFHVPDLIIPLPRNKKNFNANSIAIEVELTKKPYKSYIHIMEKLKDNIKFGSIVYYALNGDIANPIREAYKEIGGLGNTKLYIFEFKVPSPSSKYFIK